MVTIGLGIGKSLRLVGATKYDFMLGAKARTQAIKSYAEIVELEARQTRGLRAFGWGLMTVLRVPKEHPAPAPEKELRYEPLLPASQRSRRRWQCWKTPQTPEGLRSISDFD